MKKLMMIASLVAALVATGAQPATAKPRAKASYTQCPSYAYANQAAVNFSAKWHGAPSGTYWINRAFHTYMARDGGGTQHCLADVAVCGQYGPYYFWEYVQVQYDPMVHGVIWEWSHSENGSPC